ncbi:hypothetical protein [Peribacillus sp. SCS-155]|uniref:hypothetical protein n=1 Tax=Peribacillus sedimenti TaxID=3115297 RepID=UPI0039064FFD
MSSTFLTETDLLSIEKWISCMGPKIISGTQSRKKRTKQAKAALNLEYEQIDSGKHRIVYDIGDGYVVKIAMSVRGLRCNKIEWDMYNTCPQILRKHLCPIAEYGHGWIIMKKMDTRVAENEIYDKKLADMEELFLSHGIRTSDVRLDSNAPKRRNVALTEQDEIVFIDYGNFKYIETAK